jgi:hypothetical protein
VRLVGSGPITLVGSGPITVINADLAMKQARAAKRLLQEIRERGRVASGAGAQVRREQGEGTRKRIFRLWDELARKGRPDRLRASLIARELSVTPRWVRKVVQTRNQ